MRSELVEAADRWLVPMAGRTVTQCRVDYAFSLITEDDSAGPFEVRIEQPFVVEGDGTAVVIDPDGDPALIAPALRVLRQDIEHAVAFKDGRLQMTFGDGAELRVPVSKNHEAWSIVGPAGLRLVSLPGGEVAVWRPDHDARH